MPSQTLIGCFHIYLAFLSISRNDLLEGILSFPMFTSRSNSQSRSVANLNSAIRNGLSISSSGKLNVVQVLLEMTPSDTNLDAAEPSGGLFSFTSKSFQKAARWAGEFISGEEKIEILEPPVILLDVQRYEPKGLVGMTMRVLRRRFFNLWARPPPSWTNAVSYGDPAVPGTFVSRKRTRLPATVKNEVSPSESKSKLRRTRDAILSSFLSVTRPIRKMAKGRLGQDHIENNSKKDRNSDLYLMQGTSPSQLGIFGRRIREDDDEEKSRKDFEDEKKTGTMSRLKNWISAKENSIISPNSLSSWSTTKSGEEFTVPNWLPWSRENVLQSNKDVMDLPQTDNDDLKGGWSISGYFSGESETVMTSVMDGNDTEKNNQSLVDVPISVMAAVRDAQIFDGIKYLYYTAIEGVKDIWLPHVDVVQSYEASQIDKNLKTSNSEQIIVSDNYGKALLPQNVPSTVLSKYTERDNSDNNINSRRKSNQGEIVIESVSEREEEGEEILLVKNIPLWRWMIPNNVIADSMVDFGDSVKSKIWSTISIAVPEKDDSLSKLKEKTGSSPEDSTSAFSYVYDGLAKSAGIMSQSIVEKTLTITDNVVAFVASPQWDGYLKETVNFFEMNNNSNNAIANTNSGDFNFNINSISTSFGDFGDGLYKGVLNLGTSVGLRKENVVSLVMDQDHSEQPLAFDFDDKASVSTELVVSSMEIEEVPKNFETRSSASLLKVPKESPVKLIVPTMRNILLLPLYSLSKNTFPVTIMLYRYVSHQIVKLWRIEKNKENEAENELKTSSLSEGLSYTLSSLETTDNANKGATRLQSILAFSVRVVPILRIISPIFRWKTGRPIEFLDDKNEMKLPQMIDNSKSIDKKEQNERGRGKGKEKDSFVHVHVGESERFYDLWKDEKKIENGIDTSVPKKKENGMAASSFPFDEEAVTTATKSILRGLPVYQNSREDRTIDEKELALKEKEEEALQLYDPTLVPLEANKIPFPFMIGSENLGNTIDFMQQFKSPFFQSSNTNAESKIAPISDSNSPETKESKMKAISQFARPEKLVSTVPPSVSVPGSVPVSGLNQGQSLIGSIPSLTAVSVPKIKAMPSIGLPILNSTFPFNFPFDSFRGFGGLSLAPAAVRDIGELTLTDSDDRERQGDIYRQLVTNVGVGVINNDAEILSKIGRRSQDMRSRPLFADNDRVPLPTKADLSLILSRRVSIAVTAALSCQTAGDVEEYIREIGLKSLISAITEDQSDDTQIESLSLRGIKGMCRLIRIDNSVAVKIVAVDEVVIALCEAMETPLKGFRTFRSQVDRDNELIMQREAIALVQRIVRSSDKAVEILRQNVRLRKVLSQVAAQGDVFTSPVSVAEQQAGNALAPPVTSSGGNSRSLMERKLLEKKKQERKEKKSYANTTVVEYRNQSSHQMARVASWGLGGVQWKGRQPGQKGLRILSFDGGGTRGVLSIAMLKEIMNRISPNEKVQPYELFDIICGTSTGGIIAVLLGAQRRSVGETEALYDDFIDKVFGKKSNLKLVSETAAYDELELEKLLYSMCGDELLLDSNRYDCSRVFCLSTKVNNNPPQAKVWRNYNYPPGQRSRYPGAFRINTVTAVRATSAAPTFFTPVQWEQGLYCDGALVANNPTAIALQEAKVLYPGVPVELVVSIGTGYYNNKEKLRTMGWDLLVNQLIASSTDTEDVHALLNDFLPEEKYFRFNPLLQDLLAIDEKNKAVLLDLKRIAKATFVGMETGEEAKHVEFLINTLRGSIK